MKIYTSLQFKKNFTWEQYDDTEEESSSDEGKYKKKDKKRKKKKKRKDTPWDSSESR